MASYTIETNQPFQIFVSEDFIQTGWSISEGVAIHDGCNAGFIKNDGIDLVLGESYTIVFDVKTMESGYVRPFLGTAGGTNVTTTGQKTDTITVTGNTDFSFFSTGKNSVSFLTIYPTSQLSVNNGQTFSFNEANNKWVNYQSWQPDFMCRFLNSFFLFKDGALWENDVNEVRNNFFGVQYSSKVTFYINTEPTAVKDFFSMRQKSNKVWSVPEISIMPSEGKSQGQLSRLKKGRFRRLQSDFFADFLRNMLDPRFVTELEALVAGADLQGSVMKITMENDDITEVRMLSVDVTFANSEYTY